MKNNSGFLSSLFAVIALIAILTVPIFFFIGVSAVFSGDDNDKKTEAITKIVDSDGYGEISAITGRPRTRYVCGYYRS